MSGSGELMAAPRKLVAELTSTVRDALSSEATKQIDERPGEDVGPGTQGAGDVGAV